MKASELRNKSVFLMGEVHFYGSLSFAIFALIYWFLLHSTYMLISDFVVAALGCLNWLIYLKIRKNGEHDKLMATTFLIIAYLGIMNAVIHVGVDHSPLIYWGLSVIMVASYIYSIRGTLIWFFFGLIFFPLTLYLKRNWFADQVIPLNRFQTEFLNVTSYFGILAFFVYLLYFFKKRLTLTMVNLNDSQEKYHGLFSASMDAIIVFDQDTLVINDANPAFCNLYGYSRDEVLGMRVPDISAEPEQTVAVIKANSLRVISRFHKKKDGTIFPVEISSGYFIDKDRNFSVGTFRDVSERVRIEEERERLYRAERQAHLEAHQVNQSKDVFLSTLSHELRTPLTAIQGWAQLLRIGKLDEAKTKHAIEAIEKSALAQGRIINDILDISRIIMGKLQLEVNEMNPIAIVNDAIDSVRIAVEEKGLEIQTNFDSDIISINADPIRIKQIIWNLLSNATKFSQKNGKISVQLKRSGEQWLRITVSDNGKGIPTTLLKEIFNPFKQVDSSSIRSHGGLGLGLTIVRTLVELHGGSVTAESEGNDKGSTFTVLLPLGKNQQTQLNSKNKATATGEVNLKNVRILVVDDEIGMRDVLCSLFISFGANVKCAASVEEALHIFPEFHPQILVSDIAMPKEDGYSLIQKVRTQMPPPLSTIPAIALSAHAGEEAIRLSLESGFQIHVSKPVDSMMLLSTIASFL